MKAQWNTPENKYICLNIFISLKPWKCVCVFSVQELTLNFPVHLNWTFSFHACKTIFPNSKSCCCNSDGIFCYNCDKIFSDNSDGIFSYNSDDIFSYNSDGIFNFNCDGIFSFNSDGIYSNNSDGIFNRLLFYYGIGY